MSGTIGEILRDYLKQQGFTDPDLLAKMTDKAKDKKHANK